MFGDTVFTLFTLEEPEETWFQWGESTHEPLGLAIIEADVVDHFNSHVRPAMYEITNAKVVDADPELLKFNKGFKDGIPIKRVVSYSLPFMHQAVAGETIIACGLLELVIPKKGEKYHRLVVGYFDAYLTERREKEFIKVKR